MFTESGEKSGRITLRVDPEDHPQLGPAADALGLDLNGLLNLMSREALPGYLDRARKVAEERSQAQAGMDAATIHAENPFVRQLAAAGRKEADEWGRIT